MGGGIPLAQAAGAESVTLTTSQMPQHTHPFAGSTGPGADQQPTNNVFAGSPNVRMFREANVGAAMSALALNPTGGSQPHTNFQPYLCADFIISMFGIFPSPT